jgi:capsular exopolysaccharide synthesis family protein
VIKTINLYQNQDDLFNNSIDDIIMNIMKKQRMNNMKSMLFCGSDPSVGTTTITINLAVALAQSRKKVLFIDSDMRKFTTDKRLGESESYGLTEYLNNNATLSEIINETNIDSLDYITSGLSTSYSAKLLSSETLDTLFSSLNEKYDIILVDSPSLGAVFDGSVLSMLVDGIFIVVELGKTTKTDIRRTVQNLSVSYNKILGILINKVNKPEYRLYMKNYDYFKNKKYIHQ